jgi:AAA15 family ATPase/GTPase
LDEKFNLDHHRIPSTSSVSGGLTATKVGKVSSGLLSGMEREERVDLKTLTEANGCLPLASSKEVQTSLLNLSGSNKPSPVSTSKKMEITSAKTGRAKFERGHQLSKHSAGKDSELETRKEVGKLIFKMGEELRDLSKKAIPTQKQEISEGQNLGSLKPHCSNPLCRHNSPSTATVSTNSSTKKLICMCGRTMTMISLVSQDTTTKPDDNIVSDVS